MTMVMMNDCQGSLPFKDPSFFSQPTTGSPPSNAMQIRPQSAMHCIAVAGSTTPVIKVQGGGWKFVHQINPRYWVKITPEKRLTQPMQLLTKPYQTPDHENYTKHHEFRSLSHPSTKPR